MSETPGLTPDSSAAAQVASIVWMKAKAMKDNDLAEIDYDVRVTDQYGNSAKDSGTLRAEPFKVDMPDLSAPPSETGEQQKGGFFSRG
jgi:hypothetical protein